MSIRIRQMPGHSILVGALYAFAFVVAWQHSIDQWYLPAGLRFAALLVLPYRYWPLIFAGELSALSYIRHDLIPFYGMDWFVVSTPLPIAITAAGIAILKEKTNWSGIKDLDTAHLIASAAPIACLIGLANIACITFLMKPYAVMHGNVDVIHDVTTQQGKLLNFTLGYYLGMLAIAPLLVLLSPKSRRQLQSKAFLSQAFATLVFVVIAATLVNNISSNDTDFLQAMRLVILIPAIVVTLTNGLNGAIVGVVTTNIGIALTFPTMHKLGAEDHYALIIQVILALLATTLLLLGASISKFYLRALTSEHDRDQALDLARTSFISSEKHLRNKAIQVTKSNDLLELSRKSIIKWLRENGHSAAAMDMTRHGLTQSKLLHDSIISSIYPLIIEHEGLYEALQCNAVSESLLDEGCSIIHRLRGNPKELSIDLQLAAYRLVVDTLSAYAIDQPERIIIRARCGAMHGMHGVMLAIFAVGTAGSVPTIKAPMLHSRVKAYRGRIHEEHGRISILITEQRVQAIKMAPRFGGHRLAVS